MIALALLLMLGQGYKDATFHFARLEYRMDHDDSYIKGWYTDYPSMDTNSVHLINRITGVTAAVAKVRPNAAALHMFPFVYVVEPEQMLLSQAEAANLRTWILRGGFLFLDDFHGETEFKQTMDNVQKILPDAVPEELHTNHPLFHVFYDINKIERVVNDGIAMCRPECEQWENGPTGKDPKVFAVFSKQGDIQILMSYNNDVGDGLEFADEPKYPHEMTTYATKFLINVVIWALTH